MIDAINHMHIIKSTDKSLDINIEKRLRLNFWNKLKLILNIFPNKKMKLFLKRGYKRMNK